MSSLLLFRCRVTLQRHAMGAVEHFEGIFGGVLSQHGHRHRHHFCPRVVHPHHFVAFAPPPLLPAAKIFLLLVVVIVIDAATTGIATVRDAVLDAGLHAPSINLHGDHLVKLTHSSDRASVSSTAAVQFQQPVVHRQLIVEGGGRGGGGGGTNDRTEGSEHPAEGERHGVGVQMKESVVRLGVLHREPSFLLH